MSNLTGQFFTRWPAADNVLVALIYLILGTLGLSFALAPGYASPIFPAAGFAVAILLWSDRRVWPGILAGSLVLNLGVAWLQGGLGWQGALVAVGIASGATAQALFGRLLVARSVGTRWRTLESDRDNVYVLALAGPVAGMISATTGITTLYATGVIPAAEVLHAWFNWWSGDTLGVLIMLPISLTVLYRREALWRGRLATMVVPMLLTLALVGGAFYTVARWERAEQKLRIQAHGEALATLLKQRFIAHREALSALRRLIEVTPEMSYAQFDYFTQITLKDNPDIFALSFNPYVLANRRQAFERSMVGKTGKADFQITERDSQRRLVRAAERDEYVAVGYIAPLMGNRPAIGYDINSELVRHAAIQQSIRSGALAVTAPLRLVQENRDRVGVLLLDPATRRETLVGFAVGVIKVDQMVEIATRAATIPGLVFQVEDAQAASDKATVYRSEQATSSLDADIAWQQQIAIADRTWTLKLAPTPGYLRQQPHWAALVVGAGGLVLAALLQMLLLGMSGRNALIQRKVQEQTTELEIKSGILEEWNAQMSALFNLSPDGFVTFDRQHRVRYINPAFQNMTGLTAAIVGHTQAELEQRLRALAEQPGQWPGLEACFAKVGADGTAHAEPKRHLLALRPPHAVVLHLVGVDSNAASVSRLLYLSDVTHESEVDRMKSEFLSTAAHELRTPMASIYGFAEVLLMLEHDEATRHELLDIMYKQAEVMANIINELLDIARIEARRGKDFVLECVAPDALVTEALTGYKLPVGRNAPVVSPPALPLHIHVDRAKLQQAITNLLSNAYKYSPAGGDVDIKFVTAEDGGVVGITVTDHGIGMKPAEVARVCERFYRADTSGKILGTGLGMSIVKEIIELHGGTVAIESSFGVGTTVTLWLPVFRSSP